MHAPSLNSVMPRVLYWNWMIRVLPYLTGIQDTLDYKPLFVYYEREYAGFINGGSFMWANTENENFHNALILQERTIPEITDSIVPGESFEIFWDGEPLSDIESATLTINGPLEGDSQIVIQDDQGSTSIIIGADKTNQLGPGENTIYVDFRTNPELQEATDAGGDIIERYRPANRTIQVKDLQ